MAVHRVLGSVPGRVIQKFLDDQAPNWAVIIAWNALLAMFPIVLVAAALLGIVLRLAGIGTERIYSQLVSIVPGAAKDLTDVLENVKQQTGLLAVLGLLGLAWGGSALFGAMEHAFSVVYQVKPRDFMRGKLMSIGMVFLFTILAGVAVFTSSILPALKQVPGVPDFLVSDAGAAIQFVIGVTSGFILFGVIYFVVPNRKLRLSQVWPGALATGILFEIVTLLFPLYLTINKGLNAYGKTFGLFFLLMTFFYLVGLITMVGVEVNSVLYPKAPIHVVAPPAPATEPAPPTPAPPAPPRRRRVRTGIALVLGLLASGVGVVLGRRTFSKN